MSLLSLNTKVHDQFISITTPANSSSLLYHLTKNHPFQTSILQLITLPWFLIDHNPLGDDSQQGLMEYSHPWPINYPKAMRHFP